LRRLVQADPHEAAVAAHQPHGLLRVQRSLGRQPAAVAVHGAVDHGGHRAVVAGGVVGAALLPQRDAGGTDHGAQVADHRHGGLLRERATKGAGTTGGTSRNEDVLTRIPSRTGGEGCLARPQSGEHRTVVVAGFVADTATGADQAERNEALFRWGRTYERWRTRNRRKTSEGGRAGDTARSTSVHASTTSSGRSLVRDDSPSPWGYPRVRGMCHFGAGTRSRRRRSPGGPGGHTAVRCPEARPNVAAGRHVKARLCPVLASSMLGAWQMFFLWSRPGCVRRWVSRTRAPRSPSWARTASRCCASRRATSCGAPPSARPRSR